MRKDQLTFAIFADENDCVTASNRRVRRVSGSSDATGRYARLKQQLDTGSLFGGRWHEVDTSGEPSLSPLRRLTHVDLFSGAGGMCQGFRQAGFSKVLSMPIRLAGTNLPGPDLRTPWDVSRVSPGPSA